MTGGTGTFGREFIRQALLGGRYRRVICFSRDEFKQWQMREEFGAWEEMRWFLGDVRDLDRLRMAFRGVDIVVHAAALKHVPSGESNPMEVVKTNVFGANNVAIAAIECGVRKVIALSSDKACNPANLYGASKLCADRLFISSNAVSGQGGTRFSIVRYGNVTGSRGSVIPLFLKQRAKPVPMTVTDPGMTRFLIRIEEGAAFVREALEDMAGGEIFVPKIPAATVGDIARAVDPGSKWVLIPVRPGEKYHEVLVARAEARATISQPGRYVIQPDADWYEASLQGEQVPNDFEFNSLEARRLTHEELAVMVEEVRQATSRLAPFDLGAGHRGGDTGTAERCADAGK